MRKRRTFTAEEKANIVLEMLREERATAEIASAYGIHSAMLNWMLYLGCNIGIGTEPLIPD